LVELKQPKEMKRQLQGRMLMQTMKVLKDALRRENYAAVEELKRETERKKEQNLAELQQLEIMKCD
jgi:hypothetical protein